ncbi:xylulokinase [Vibrio parahaemolyticus]|nr:xylulokinase [Vibrio parahaemolyticus]
MYIGIDCGTQSTKGVLWYEGKVLASSSVPHSLQSDATGKKEQHPNQWYLAMLKAIEDLIYQCPNSKLNIKGIGVSGQQHGLVILDKNDRVIRNSLLWCDTRPTQELKAFISKYAIDFNLRLGIHVPVAFTIAKLLWVKHHHPTQFAQISKILLPHDYLNYMLTGEYVAEPGDSSGTGWLDTYTRTFDASLMSILDLPDYFSFPRLVHSNQVIGKLSSTITNKFGLNSNVQVSSGGGDNMMAAIGTGNVDNSKITMSMGTSGTVFTHAQTQVPREHDPDINAFCSSTNGYLPLVSTMNVTSATSSILCLIDQNVRDFDDLLNNAEPGANGLISLPFYSGARLPRKSNIKGALIGMTNDNLTQENLLRANVESISFNLNRAVNILKENCDLNLDTITLVGGGAKSKVWRQLISDITGVPIRVPVESESAAIGSAIQAYWSINDNSNIKDICQEYIQFDSNAMCHPNGDNNQSYRDSFVHYLDICEYYTNSKLNGS